MKKTLIALAALALAGAASAQSSVTLYGVADLSLSKTDSTDAQMSGNGTLNNGNSRLGVRGTEDLGGGMKASFNFEQGNNLETGATDAATYQRNAFMELSGGFGSLRMGRSLSPSFYGVAAWELTGTANYSAVASQFAFGGAGPRNNSAWAYTTPSMGGLKATVGYVMKLDTGAGGSAKTDLNVTYAGGPLTVALTYNKVEAANDGNMSLGANYNLGAFQVAGSFQRMAVVGGTQQGFTLGGATQMGPVNLVIDLARNNDTEDTDMVFEAKYALSKRTTVYGVFHRNGKTKFAGSVDVDTYGVGVRHNF